MLYTKMISKGAGKYIAPKDANGVFVVDGSMSGFGLLDSPIEISVRNRYVTSIKGKQAGKLEAMLDRVGEKARNIAELGIGINPEAKLIGNVIAGIHLDGIIKNPVLFLDSEKFILSHDNI
jgi:hypothetical protein